MDWNLKTSVSKKNRIKIDKLAGFILYILGHRPDEFGLVPAPDGSVTFKELLWAIHEEPGWSYVRQSNINEVLLSKDRGLFRTRDNRISARDRRWRFDLENPSEVLPKILFTAVRRKAYPHLMEKGLNSPEEKYIVLSSEKEMAMRIGKRREQKPILLEVLTGPAISKGVLFFLLGNIVLSKKIPAKFISGPPIPKKSDRDIKPEIKKERQALSQADAGAFILDIKRDPDTSPRKGKKRKGWKEASRKIRRR